MSTHYIPAFTQRRGRGAHAEQVAACGRWVSAEEHDIEPTCGECKKWLADDEEGRASLDTIDSNPVISTAFSRDITGGHERARR